MTDIKSAKDFLIKETYCRFNKGDCDLDCGVCESNIDSYGYDGDTHKAIYDTAIRSLKAWEEVLQELEDRYNGDDETVGTFNIGIKECIDIIKQKLAEIK